MDRFATRSAPGVTNTSPPKKPKSGAKQRNMSAVFRVQEYKVYCVDRRKVIYSRKQFVYMRRDIYSRKQFVDKRELRVYFTVL